MDKRNPERVAQDVLTVTDVKERYVKSLFGRPGVHGVGVGWVAKDGAETDEVGLLVYVDKKLPVHELQKEL